MVHQLPTMFTTFLGPSPRSSESGPNSASPNGSQPPRPRQKRSQVARACDYCRVHRIKCDNNHPCLNCQTRGGQCSNDHTNGVRTLPHAFREIERLKQRNQELQKELEEERSRNRNQVVTPTGSSSSQLPTPPNISSSSSISITTPSGPYSYDAVSSRRYWEGIYTNTARSASKTWYGPASLLYFISRLNAFLASTLQQHLPESSLQPNSASRLLDGPTSPPDKQTDEHDQVPPDDPIKAKEYLTATQEEYFLDLYWQSHHTSLLVLDEDNFRRHYKSLWVGSRKKRKPSALVDIVIALCMQYGMARGRGNNNSVTGNANVDTDDATLAGRWHYCRCQNLLACELESPTISTLQCNILSVVWLCCASFQNMADSTLAVTARTAQMLGLHLPPPQSMPQREREMRKRLWWSIYVAETKTSMKLGRPFMLHLSHASCGLPADDHEAAAQSGSGFAPLDDDVTWLSWNLHNTKLVLAARDVYTAFYDKYPDFVEGDGNQTIYDAPAAMETYAEFLIMRMRALEQWVKDVPDALKTQRKNHGIPFSTDLSPVEIEQFAPLWVQRQRLLLELLYHNLCTNLYRPFISFKRSPYSLVSSQSSSLAESCAHRCASHAMALTHIMRQILSTTDILTGWQEAFQWEWNVAMTLVGFVLSHPHDELTPAAREAISVSVNALGIFGNSFSVAASAAELVRELSVTADHMIMPQLINEGDRLITQEGQPIIMMHQSEQEGTVMGQPDVGFPMFDEDTIAVMQGILADSMDLAFAVDGYNTTNVLWPNIDSTE
ncbi:fungal-specific transcription factor domain-containing protein [Daldinia decipiens]|uniref:fungal-specific transcription factor domain-containing protein n=1 Tax=Daldinia decipiens TaxID=326647 RepID=UPI0020C2972B|nr:fungal-specific transcription factor domain-containing protein [Daldinia decipiens]KAI1654612.1 fungal-specific transcription factor domain-containing protein [Daldinia decipiens]